MKSTDYLLKRLDDLEDDAFIEVLGAATERVAEVTPEPKTGTTHISEMHSRIETMRGLRGKFQGFSTGYTGLDNKMGGIRKGTVLLVGGETNNGKSVFAANLAVNIGRALCNVLYITLEMTTDEMLDRFDKISGGTLEEIDITLQDDFDIGYNDLEKLVDASIEEHGTEVVVVDYLQYLGRGMDEREVAKMSKKLKYLALTRNIAFIVIVSLRKPGSDVRNRRKWVDIEIEDMMGTAAIGYDCDTAVIVSRKDEENEYDEDHIYVKVLKTRGTKMPYNSRIAKLRWHDSMKVDEEWITPAKAPTEALNVAQSFQASFLKAGQ